MPTVTFVDTLEAERTVQATTGISLMETAIAWGVTGIEALCGGARACGTCHVYVDPDWREAVGPPAAEEAALLDTTGRRRPESRLACQICVRDDFEGLRVRVAIQKL